MEIYSGNLALAGSYPSYGIVFADAPLLCGAVLIHDDIMLTCSSCFGEFENKNIYIGGIYGDKNDAKEVRLVESEHLHPQNFRNDVFGGYFDIMLLKLSSPSGQQITPINNDPSIPLLNSFATSLHYPFRSQDDQIGKELTEFNRTIQSCNTFPSPFYNDDQYFICADGLGVDTTCLQRNGNPLIQNNKVVGLFTFDICNKTAPVLFNRISIHNSWIDAKICALSAVKPKKCQSDVPSLAPSTFDYLKTPALVEHTYMTKFSTPKPLDESNGLSVIINSTEACDSIRNIQVRIQLAATSDIAGLYAFMKAPNLPPFLLFDTTQIATETLKAFDPDGTTLIIDENFYGEFGVVAMAKCSSGICPKYLEFQSSGAGLSTLRQKSYVNQQMWQIFIASDSNGSSSLLSAALKITCQPLLSSTPSIMPSLMPSILPTKKVLSPEPNSTSRKSCGLFKKSLFCPIRSYCGTIGRMLGWCNVDIDCGPIQHFLGKC